VATLTPHFRFGNSHPAVQLGPIAVVNSDDTDASLLLSTSCALPPLDNVLAVMSVYRISAKIIRTSCAVCSIGRFIDTARIVCVAGSMKRPGVCPSVRPVCLSHHSAGARRCSGFAAVGRKYWSIAARPALSSKCDQCHVVSWSQTC